MRLPVLSVRIALNLAAGAALCLPLAAQNLVGTDSARDRLHQTDQWRMIEQHLPNPATASPQDLEQEADILRARRFPEDAMDYYKYAMARGGDAAELLNKI